MITEVVDILIAAVLIAGFLFGIRLMQSPRTALWGNRLGAMCMGLAILYTMLWTGLLTNPIVWLSIALGGILGLGLGQRIKMIQMPQMVALLNGLGGSASALVAGVAIMIYITETSLLFWFTAALALAIGALTFSGSIVAALKLQGWMGQHPVMLRGHLLLLRGLLFTGIVLILFSTFVYAVPFLFLAIVLIFFAYGVFMALRVGGADMPIIISLLNSFSGIAASVCGLAVNNGLLAGVGALVGVAGLVLTQLMCRAINRNLPAVLGGFVRPACAIKYEPAQENISAAPAGEAQIPHILADAQSVVIVPGYGMAVAQAQSAVKELVNTLESKGKQVKIAVHPVAGRMPGHMNVLLAEVGIDYEMLFDMDTINPQFSHTDLVIVIGACDVINPAANTGADTPICGMPILEVGHAKNIILCNRDPQPGYSGVENTLYEQDQVIARWGDASETVPELTAMLLKRDLAQDTQHETVSAAPAGEDQIPGILAAAQTVIIVPGYGMAVAQAQRAVKDLVAALEGKGKQARIAVHPVAGRMPGHMNVLLAEVGIDYDMLFDMDTINPQFPHTDLVIVVGACDVINPAANTAEETPIYGMPILEVGHAKNVIICNRDPQPGYSGVENTLYEQAQVIALWGDAGESVPKLTAMMLGQ